MYLVTSKSNLWHLSHDWDLAAAKRLRFPQWIYSTGVCLPICTSYVWERGWSRGNIV